MKKTLKKWLEKTIEGILFLSSTITTLTVILIVVFLFKEGKSLFQSTPIEEGFVLAVNKANAAGNLSANQIKNIFDQNIINWKELGGNDEPIFLFRMDDLSNYYTDEELGENFEFVPQRTNEFIDKTPGIIAFFPSKNIDSNFSGKILPIEKTTLKQFLSEKEWFPTAQPVAQLGVLSLILGTLWVSFGAILIALPLGLATAIYMAEIATKRVRNILKPLIELLAGIPSVVYGFFGLIVIVPQIQSLFGLPVGETALAGSIILGIMALPTIVTISEDALRTTPNAMKEASLALGANKWQTIHRVVIPYAGSGITAAAILGIGRAIGETMAVLMVTGNAAIIPHTFLEPVRTIPATIAAELGEAPQGGMHFKALFALGCILFIMTIVVNLTVEFISSRRKNKISH
ncbi:MAG: phosphate ABC transporter permease subunit PstC [Bacteroidetes bacterium]|nr:phosphate ABC transporter permease subunit PstC [Bacteroidota bacterium]